MTEHLSSLKLEVDVKNWKSEVVLMVEFQREMWYFFRALKFENWG